MKISLIAAMAKNRVIGKNNQMPWHLPADLKHFKVITTNKPIIMGRKTFESLGRPLPNRRNIVVTRQKDFMVQGAEVVCSIDAALALVGDAVEVMIIGGAEIYRQAISLANTMYLTMIDLDCEGDAYFPEWNLTQWQTIESESFMPDDKNPYAYRFVTFRRKAKID